MLMEPASKVSVPLTVVMRTRSRVPERAFVPALTAPVPEFASDPAAVHVFPEMFVNTTAPCRVSAAEAPLKLMKPVVEPALAVPVRLAATYPEVSIEPAPI